MSHVQEIETTIRQHELLPVLLAITSGDKRKLIGAENFLFHGSPTTN
jgi:hypothetical protein